MSDDRLRITTEDGRERLYAARRTAEICAAGGRALDAGETVYREQLMKVRTPVYGPVGR